jgi:hypothetical protein
LKKWNPSINYFFNSGIHGLIFKASVDIFSFFDFDLEPLWGGSRTAPANSELLCAGADYWLLNSAPLVLRPPRIFAKRQFFIATPS